MSGPIKKRRGRPNGHKLSEESKRSISASKMGILHTEAAKSKIAEAVSKYFTSPEYKEACTNRAEARKNRRFVIRIGNEYYMRGKLLVTNLVSEAYFFKEEYHARGTITRCLRSIEDRCSIEERTLTI